jgi:hypothetical protein
MFRMRDMVESEGFLYLTSFLVVAAIYVLYFV